MAEGQQILRGNWGTRFGFIVAASGSAVGLGNIWKFPYITGVYGGGAFVLVYLGCVLVVGLPLMIAELVIGRRAQQNPVGAFQKLHREGSPWQAVGWLGVASGFVILSYYSVVAGWALAYIYESAVGFAGTPAEIQGQFADLVNSPARSVFWHTVFMGLTVGIVLGGIKEGIERWSKILMPALVLILLGLMLYGLFATDGGARAISFLFAPNFSELTGEGFLSALGHAFFTLSLGMGAMITYGSYMGRGSYIVRDAVTISFLDTIIALLAGVAIFSLVFSYGLEPNAGTGLIWETLPVLFADTGPIISVPFFILLSFAALSSSISLLEVVVSYFIDRQGWSRTKATLIMGVLIYGIGVPCALSSLKLVFGTWESGFFNLFDVVSTNYMLPIGGLLTCIFVAWTVKDKVRTDEFRSSGFLYRAWVLLIRFVTPVAVAVVLLHGIGVIAFNKPPVVPPGALFVKEMPSTPSGDKRIGISATFADPDQPSVDAFSVTFRIVNALDSSEAFIARDLRHESEGLSIVNNDDGTYTARYSFFPDPEFMQGNYDLVFEVSDGSDVAKDSLTDYIESLQPAPDSVVTDTLTVE
jgi:NSS family neurotransmitter:Na+ symporter